METEDKITIQRRLPLAKEEMKYEPDYDHSIINPNGQPELALKSLEKNRSRLKVKGNYSKSLFLQSLYKSVI